MKAKIFYIIPFIIIGAIALVAAPLASWVPNNCLPIVMILSDEDSGLYANDFADNDPVYTMLKASIEAELPIIVSTPILYWLTKRTVEGRNSDFDWTKAMQQRYNVSVSNGKKFGLLIPQKYGDNPDLLGFVCDYIKPVAHQQLKKTFAQKIFSYQENFPQELEKLLHKNSLMHAVCPKYFYIAGHGMDAMTEPHFLRSDPVMAQLPLHDMVNMLQILNGANTCAVYLLTCYAAGSNLVQLQNLLSGTVTDERCPSVHSLNFPLLVQCTTDTASTRIAGKYFSLAGLFNDIIQWANEPSDCNKLTERLGASFAKAPADERFSNFPICRLPGSYSHFRALSLPQTTVIQNRISCTQTIEIPESAEMIQLYPSNARKLTIHINRMLPMMMSRIPGPAHHFIGTLDIKAKGTVETVIKHMFLNGLDADGQIFYGVADKGWFIQKVLSNGKTIAEGLAIYKGSLKQAQQTMTAIYKGSDGNFYLLQSALSLNFGMPQRQRIDEKTYAHMLGSIFWQTMPAQDALDEATNCSETLKDQSSLLNGFCNSLELKTPIMTKKELIEQDFKMLEKDELTVEHYINYATYLHDKEFTAAIVEAALAGKIFSPYDCLTLLVNLIADGHHDLALEQLHIISAQKNSNALAIALDTFTNMAADQRDALIERSKNDIIACIKNNCNCKGNDADETKKQLTGFIKMLAQNDHKTLAAQLIDEIRHSSCPAPLNIGNYLESDLQKLIAWQ